MVIALFMFSWSHQLDQTSTDRWLPFYGRIFFLVFLTATLQRSNVQWNVTLPFCSYWDIWGDCKSMKWDSHLQMSSPEWKNFHCSSQLWRTCGLKCLRGMHLWACECILICVYKHLWKKIIYTCNVLLLYFLFILYYYEIVHQFIGVRFLKMENSVCSFLYSVQEWDNWII